MTLLQCALFSHHLHGQAYSQLFSCQKDTAFQIYLGGMLDGQNCQKVHEYTAAGWPDKKRIPAIEPLDSIVLYNASESDISMLQIVSSTNNIYSIDSLSHQVCSVASTNSEDSIHDIYRYMASHNYYYYVPEIESREFKDVTRHQGVYGYGHCGSIANCVTMIGKKLLGPSQRMWYIDDGNHGISELFMNGKFYYVDADEEMMVKDRRNKRYLSFGEAYEDLYLFYRTKCFGNGLMYSFPNSVNYSVARYFNNPLHQHTDAYLYSQASCYVDDTVGNYGPELGFTLKAGERMKWSSYRDSSFDFHHYPRFYCSGTNYGYLPDSSNVLPVIHNVETHYDLFGSNQSLQDKFLQFSNILWLYSQHRIIADSVSNAGFKWHRFSYFPYVSGTLKMEAEFSNSNDSMQVLISFNNHVWQPLITLNSLNASAIIPLDSSIKPHSSLSKHHIYIQVNFFTDTLTGSASLKKFEVKLNEQSSAFLYPTLTRGDNRIHFRLKDTLMNGDLQAGVFWHEHNENQPPSSPQFAVYPLNNSTVNKTDIPFSWEPVLIDQEGDSIREWHFQLSEYSDFHRVLSNNFDYMSLNEEGSNPYFLNYFDTLNSRNTFFNHNTTYYWRVQIRDSRNAWSEWSSPWRFTVHAPMPVRNLHFEPTTLGSNVLSLVWQKDDQDNLTNHYMILNNNQPNSLYPHSSQVPSFFSTSNYYSLIADTNRKAFRVFAQDAANNLSGASPVVCLPAKVAFDINDVLDFTDTIEALQHPFPDYPSLGRNYFLLYDTNYFQFVNNNAVRFKTVCRGMISICYTDETDTIYKRQYLVSNQRYASLLVDCATDGFNVYPNPVFQELHIRGDDYQGVPKYLYNSVGSLLLQTLLNDIDLSSFPAGIYFLKCNGLVSKIRVD